jgi:hypothetical protein
VNYYPSPHRWWRDGLVWSFALAILLGGIVGAAVAVVIVA